LVLGAAPLPTPRCAFAPVLRRKVRTTESDLNRDQDLTRLNPKGKDAEGTVIELSGVIQDASCTPLAGALIEIWQANTHGKYDHSGDSNPLAKDPNFQHWGRMTTEEGWCLFIPYHHSGSLPLDPSLVGKTPSGPRQFRPPHIHVKITARGFQSLTTQLYFHEDSYSDAVTKDSR
jgi:protocatechuate 3,4-dioxygenase beta subunit